jgi:hypothetical protein
MWKFNYKFKQDPPTNYRVIKWIIGKEIMPISDLSCPSMCGRAWGEFTCQCELDGSWMQAVHPAKVLLIVVENPCHRTKNALPLGVSNQTLVSYLAFE